MKCMKCGHEMLDGRENVQYRDLPNVTLVEVPVSRCANCGGFEVEIPSPERLNRALATLLIFSPARLGGRQIRFLRAHLGFTATEFGEIIGYDKATISRWETGALEIGQHAERLLRLLVAHAKQIVGYQIETLRDVAREDAPAAKPIRLKASGEGAKAAWATV